MGGGGEGVTSFFAMRRLLEILEVRFVLFFLATAMIGLLLIKKKKKKILKISDFYRVSWMQAKIAAAGSLGILMFGIASSLPDSS